MINLYFLTIGSAKSKNKEEIDYEIPKFLREGTSAKDIRKRAKEIPKQELPKIKKDIA